MMILKQIKESLLHLVYPHVCEGCGSDTISQDEFLCLRCRQELPFTRYEKIKANPVEKIFWGRMNIMKACSVFYFTKGSSIQQLMHQVKYGGNRELAVYLGRMMGNALGHSDFYKGIDTIIPLPLHTSRLKKRGYNQAAMLGKGISEVLEIPLEETAVRREWSTVSQTSKTRVERWQNMMDCFRLDRQVNLENRHVLLLDDVITTGATLEACGRELLKIPGISLSICTLCYSSSF